MKTTQLSKLVEEITAHEQEHGEASAAQRYRDRLVGIMSGVMTQSPGNAATEAGRAILTRWDSRS